MSTLSLAPLRPGRIRLALFLAGFATFSLLYGVQPLMPEFAREFGVGPATSSLPLSLATLGLALSIFCAGAVSDSLGRRGLMFGSMLLAALLTVSAALLPHWSGLVVARALAGIALGGVPAVAMVYLAEELPPQRLGAAVGLYVAGNAFGGMMGRLGVGLLGEWMTWRHALMTLGLVDLLLAIAFLCLLPPSRHFVRRRGVSLAFHLRAWRDQLRDPHLPWLFAVPFLVMGVFVSVYNYLGFRLGGPEFGLGPSQIGWIFSAYVFGIVSSSIAGGASDRFGRGPVVLAGVLVAMLGVALTLASTLWLIVLGVVVLTIGFFVAHASASTWVGRLGGAHRSHAASLYLLSYYFGSSMVGAGSGWFWAHGGWTALATLALGLLGVALFAALHLRRHAPDDRASAVPADRPAGD
ncbi:MAG: MFS transporter [Luteimonas sp.]